VRNHLETLGLVAYGTIVVLGALFAWGMSIAMVLVFGLPFLHA
jgi:hypothetical protein